MDVRQRRIPSTQARIREYLAEGIHESRIAVLVDVMRVCHQLSFVLFALGLTVYFRATDWTTFGIISSWFLIWSGLYLWMSTTAISRDNSPYRSPLSSIFYRFVQLIRLAGSITPGTFTRRSTGVTALNSHPSFLRRLSTEGMREAIEETVQKRSDDLDSRIVEWTFNSLTRDHEFERFFAAIPDFCDSRAVREPKFHLLALNDKQERLSRTLFVWMYRTLTSHLISEPDRQQRIKIFTKVIEAVPTIVSWSTLQRVFKTWEGLLGSVDFGSAVLRTGGDSDDPYTVFCAQCIVAIVIARAQVYDRQCINLTTRFLASDLEVRVYSRQYRLLLLILIKVSPILRGCLVHYHSALLANLIFITRIIFRFHSEHSRDKLFDVSSRTLSELTSNIDVRLASSEMQHEFCGLWNELVHEARVQVQMQAHYHTGSYVQTISTDILRHLRKGYIALHETTDGSLFFTSIDDIALTLSPGSSYPSCSVQDHLPMSPQSSHLTAVDLIYPPSSRPPLLAPRDSILQKAVVDATEDADHVTSQAGAMSDLTLVPSVPTPPRPPRAHRPSGEISQGPTITPLLSLLTHEQLSLSSGQSFRNAELPSLTPDAGQSLPLLDRAGEGNGGW
jgi:hypothetical protein